MRLVLSLSSPLRLTYTRTHSLIASYSHAHAEHSVCCSRRAPAAAFARHRVAPAVIHIASIRGAREISFDRFESIRFCTRLLHHSISHSVHSYIRTELPFANYAQTPPAHRSAAATTHSFTSSSSFTRSHSRAACTRVFAASQAR